MKRRELMLGAAATVLLAGTVRAADQVTFHFYGAEDCPPCMAFKRNHLADVQAEGRANGVIVEENVITRTRDVPKIGVYGDRDPILRLAAPQLERVYPPIFFVSQGGRIASVHGPDWSAALREARRLAGLT
ncbi:thioredoxin family protein [Phaeobacter sp.]|uniref:TlpA family protein disulfide reductase n=1 Tax=Phaeobacter sp. TaxID=1902409 RepID=UPI0025E41A36|nr:thioredoxin family protein [Phaeobacter sp.]